MKNNRKKNGLIVLIILIIIASIVWVLGNKYFKKIAEVEENITIVEMPEDKEKLEISEEVEEKLEDNSITNIAFFGIDSRHKSDIGRSDCIIVATIDNKHDKLKISSIMRDTYVPIDGHGNTKINHAYAYGGPELAVSTLNSVFDLGIKEFVTVDFYGLEDIIDKIGGVEIDVQQNEIKYINSYMTETANISNTEKVNVNEAGLQLLNGKQAVAYSRIRYLAGGDFARTERQRTVLEAIASKFMAMDKNKALELIPDLASNVETSISVADIVKLATGVLSSNYGSIEKERYPMNGNAWDAKIDGIYYLKTDLVLTKEQMHDFIFEEDESIDTSEEQNETSLNQQETN